MQHHHGAFVLSFRQHGGLSEAFEGIVVGIAAVHAEFHHMAADFGAPAGCKTHAGEAVFLINQADGPVEVVTGYCVGFHHERLPAGHFHQTQILSFHFHDRFFQHHEVFPGFPVQALVLENAVFIHQTGDKCGISDGSALADVGMDRKDHIGIPDEIDAMLRPFHIGHDTHAADDAAFDSSCKTVVECFAVAQVIGANENFLHNQFSFLGYDT